MFRYLFTLIALAGATLAYAQTPVPKPEPPKPVIAAPTLEADVPEIAEWEIERRGNMVQETGTIRASDVDIIADALAVPEDDSHKWFVCVVTKENCKYCDKLKYDIIHAKEFQAWINVDEPDKSTCHYQVRRIEDATQRDWFAAIKPRLEKGGFPAIVIQPPKNNEYGPNKTVVLLSHGYDGNPEKTTQQWRDAIIKYVRTLQERRATGENTIRKAGISQVEPGAGADSTIGAPPPFAIPNTVVNPFQPNGPVDNTWPPSAPTPFTPDQIRLMIPQADAEFCLQCMTAKVADPQTLFSYWTAWQQRKPDGTVVNPTTPTVTSGGIMGVLSLLMGGGNLLGLAFGGWMLYRKMQKANNKPLLITDEQFNYLYQLLMNGGQQQQTIQSVASAPVQIVPKGSVLQ